jgi:hypothetical protein
VTREQAWLHAAILLVATSFTFWITFSLGATIWSLCLGHADEQGRPSLVARDQDDNRVRHVGIYALFDWCWGTDAQWLYDLDNDRTIYSHDHGLYFPPAGRGGWTEPDLTHNLDVPSELPDSASGLSREAIEARAVSLEAVTREGLIAVMNSVPAGWPVDDGELEALGWFLEHRAPAVAARLRALA